MRQFLIGVAIGAFAMFKWGDQILASLTQATGAAWPLQRGGERKEPG